MGVPIATALLLVAVLAAAAIGEGRDVLERVAGPAQPRVAPVARPVAAPTVRGASSCDSG